MRTRTDGRSIRRGGFAILPAILVIVLAAGISGAELQRQVQRQTQRRQAVRRGDVTVRTQRVTDLSRLKVQAKSVKGQRGARISIPGLNAVPRTARPAQTLNARAKQDVVRSLVIEGGQEEQAGATDLLFTVENPVSESGGYIWFWNCPIVQPHQNTAVFMKNRTRSGCVIAELNLADGQSYLLDFNVRGKKFEVHYPGGSQEFNFSSEESHHVVLIYQAVGNQPNSIGLVFSGDHIGVFYSLEVTKLD